MTIEGVGKPLNFWLIPRLRTLEPKLYKGFMLFVTQVKFLMIPSLTHHGILSSRRNTLAAPWEIKCSLHPPSIPTHAQPLYLTWKNAFCDP